MSKTLVLKPRISEKAYALSQSANVYVFEVPSETNKQSVAEAVAKQFSVTVNKVNIYNSKGKRKRSVRKSGRQVMGKRPDTKRAYVTLKQGDSIPVFAAVEEAEKEAAKSGGGK